MDYSCGLGPHLGGSLKRSTNIRRSISSSKYVGGIDWHLRTQFTEQAKSLELKLDVDCTVLAELQDFYRRRAVVEQDYADALAKLANGLKQKHINEASKRPHWAPYTTTTICSTLLGSTLHLSETHSTLSEIFAKQMVQRLADMEEDANRLYKQCREMMQTCQLRVLSDTSKLQNYQREYANRQAATLEADRIRRRAEDKVLAAGQKARSKGKDPDHSQKFVRTQNEYDSKQANFINSTLATSRARNDYLIQLAATNHSVQRYFNEEIPDILDCLACGFHNSLARSAMMHLSCEEALKSCHSSVVEMLNRNITALDLRQDNACFLKRNENLFARPGSFAFANSKEDTVSLIKTDGPLREELENNAKELNLSIETLRVSTDEMWKTLEEVEKKFLELINQKDYDVACLFCTDKPRPRRTSNNLLNNQSNNNSSANLLGSSPANLAVTNSTTNNSMSSSTSSSYNPTNSSSNLLGGSKSPSQSGGHYDQSNMVSNSDAVSDSNLTGSYSTMRALYRDARIEQEKFYWDRYAMYAQEMHEYQVQRVKLSKIQQALSLAAANEPVSCPPAASSPNSKHLIRRGVPVFPKQLRSKFQNKSGCDEDSSLPPPPAPTTQQASSSEGHISSLDKNAASFHSGVTGSNSQSNLLTKSHPRRVLRVPNVGKPKLFGGTIDEYVGSSGQPIPCIILSCTRVINEFGMHQQGVFRVPGSQAEINEFKAAFERNEDPLMDIYEARDINSAAGLLKLYFRELADPPFPNTIFMDLVNCIKNRSDQPDMIRRLRELVTMGLSRPVFIVMRYLFAFLNHVSEYAEENMMDAYNLAICFGPTLMPVPVELNQVLYQSSVIELIKTFIVNHLVIFDPMLPGPIYNKRGAAQCYQQQQHKTDSDLISSPSTYQNKMMSKQPTDSRPSPAQWAHQLASQVIESGVVSRHSSTRPHNFLLGETKTSKGTEQSSSVGKLDDCGTKFGSISRNAAMVQQYDIHHNQDDEDREDEDAQSFSDNDDSDSPLTLAVARADFTGSTPRELSFQQGDEIYLYQRLNKHWWDGQLVQDQNGTRGLVPHSYVVPKSSLLLLTDQAKESKIGNRKYSDSGSEDSLDNLLNQDGDTNNKIDPQQRSSTIESIRVKKTNIPYSRDQSYSNDLLVSKTSEHYKSNDSSHLQTNYKTNISGSNPELAPAPSVRKASNLPGMSFHHSTTTSLEEGTINEQYRDEDSCSESSIGLAIERSDSAGAKLSPEMPVRHSELMHLAQRNTICYPLSSVPEDEPLAAATGVEPISPTRNFTGRCVKSSACMNSDSDFDTAIDKVLHDLTTLEREDSRHNDFRSRDYNRKLTLNLLLPSAKHTPDLVMDLPVTTESIPHPNQTTNLPDTNPISAAHHSSADQFAEQGLDTMRKRQYLSLGASNRHSFSRCPANLTSTKGGSHEELGCKTTMSNKPTYNSSQNTTTVQSDESLPSSDNIAISSESTLIPISARVAAFEANSKCSSADSSNVNRLVSHLGNTCSRPISKPKKG